MPTAPNVLHLNQILSWSDKLLNFHLPMSEEEKIPQEESAKGNEQFATNEDVANAESSNEPPSPTQIPQPQPMEVHHHGHVHEQKKWKEYLFQFFMLFLAVFCGFLAEYQLEHMIENQREKKYIISLVQDLKTDTAKLNSNIKQFERQLLSQDTLIQNFDLINTVNQLIFRSMGYFSGYPDFIYTDGTIQQLKNSGGFRLIRSSVAVDSIMAYDAEVKKALINEGYLGNRVINLVDYFTEIFNYQALYQKMKAGNT